MKYRPEINGLRAIAIIPVILFHARIPYFSGGFVGVDVFFVISGYLITSIILEEMDEGQFSLRAFYMRRARRILPAMFLVLLATIPFAWAWMMPRDLKSYSESIVSVLAFVSNFFFWRKTGYFATDAELQPLLHTWSLAVEEQYYILFPLLLLLIPQRAAFVILAGLLGMSLVLSQWMLTVEQSTAFFLLHFRAWEFLTGALAALYLQRGAALLPRSQTSNLLSGAGLAAIGYAVFGYDSTTPFPGLHALLPTVGTVFIILFAGQGEALRRVMGSRALVWLGLLSYSAYLWHQPIFALVQHRFGQEAFDAWAAPLILLSLLLAYLSYRFVEQPFRRRMNALRFVTVTGLAGMVVLAEAVTVNFLVRDDPTNVPSYRWATAHADPELLRYVERHDVRMQCGTGADALDIEQCTFGVASAPKRLVLWGDSFAGALLSGLDDVSREAGLGGVAFIANGCPPVLGLSNTKLAACSEQTHYEILRRVEQMPDVRDVIIFGNMSGAMQAGNVRVDAAATSYATVRDKFSAGIVTLHRRNIRVILLEQGPLFPNDVSSHLLQNLRLGRSTPLSINRAEHLAAIAEARQLSDIPDVYVDTVNFFCGKTMCPSVDAQGRMVIYDRDHVTRSYSRLLASYLMGRAELVHEGG